MVNKREKSIPVLPASVSYLMLAVVLMVVAYARIRLLNVPLERDEGEYAYMGQLLLKGIPPYVVSYTMKLPGVSVVYAIFMLMFGQTQAGIHLGLLLINISSVVLIFLLAQRLFDRDAAVISSSCYALLSLSESVLGIFAHATHFVVLFLLIGLLLLHYYLDVRKLSCLFLSAISFGLAFIMKQHAAPVILFALIYLIWRVYSDKGTKRTLAVNISTFATGTIAPYALIVIYLLTTGIFESFWFWTVEYASAYASIQPASNGLETFINNFSAIVASQPLPCLLALAGGILCFTSLAGPPTDKFFVPGFFFFSFLAVCPGLYFRPHYFILLLPALAITAGAAVYMVMHLGGASRMKRALQCFPPLLLIAVLCSGLYNERAYLFNFSPLEQMYNVYGANPFCGAVEIGKYVKSQTTPDDRIALLCSEPEICFYADRVSASGYIYLYALWEDQKFSEQMQEDMIREINSSSPKFVITDSQTIGSLSKMPLTRKFVINFDKYLQRSYNLVGWIDLGNSSTQSCWDDALQYYRPLSKFYMTVWRKKDSHPSSHRDS